MPEFFQAFYFYTPLNNLPGGKPSPVRLCLRHAPLPFPAKAMCALHCGAHMARQRCTAAHFGQFNIAFAE